MLFPQSSVKDPPPDVTHATLATVERLTLLSLKLMELLAAHQANPLPEHIPHDAMFSLLQGTVRPCTTDDLADALSTHALGQHVFSPLASEYRILGNDTYLILLNDTRAISTLSDEGNHKLTATILWHAPVAENAQLRFCQLSICKAPPEGCTSAASMGIRAADTLEAGVSTYLSGATLSAFQYVDVIGTLLGVNSSGDTTTINAIRKAVEKKVKAGTVRITSIKFDPTGKKVVLAVDAEVADTVAGELFSKIYEFSPGDEVVVKVKVFRKDSLVQAEWVPVGDAQTVSVGVHSQEVSVPLPSGTDYTSGFYRVEIEQ